MFRDVLGKYWLTDHKNKIKSRDNHMKIKEIATYLLRPLVLYFLEIFEMV